MLEPLEALERRGFSVSYVAPNPGGWVEAEAVLGALREDTLLVSVMHANNETGVLQPIGEIAAGLQDHPAFFHTDAAQGFGKELEALRDRRVDLISISGHKLYAPKGVGALVARRRGFRRPPLAPLMFGGGQERGLRPGTAPVPLIVGLGLAAELATKHAEARREHNLRLRRSLLRALEGSGARVHGDPERCLPHAINLSFPGVDSEALMVALKEVIAISNGSACTSQRYTPSHVLLAMGLSEEEVRGAVRLSWCHLTPEVPWAEVVEALRALA